MNMLCLAQQRLTLQTISLNGVSSFIEEYARSYRQVAPLESTIESLLTEVDRYRGMPGFYGGVQALIQASISHIEFDWSSYAEARLAEYWAWRAETVAEFVKGQ